jgi:hypothetical protein
MTVVNELVTTLVEQLSKHAEYMTDYSSAGGGGIHSAQKIEQVSIHSLSHFARRNSRPNTVLCVQIR